MNHELDWLNVDIATLSEPRLPANGSIRERVYIIFGIESHTDKNAKMELVLPYVIILYPSVNLQLLSRSDFEGSLY